uniref:SLAIN motif family, member 1b n=1 Tax=Cyprinus carpio TaxID=7962 RepID=A0A8C2BIR9_CYPCA
LSETFKNLTDPKLLNGDVSQWEIYRSAVSSDKLRRSMPNLLVSAALSPVSSSPALRSSQCFDIPAPAPLQNRVQSLGSFSSRQPLKATAYVSPTIKSSSVSLQSLSVSEIPKAPASQILSRSGLPRPASFIASGSSPRGRLSAPVQPLLTPPRSWREGCY